MKKLVLFLGGIFFILSTTPLYATDVEFVSTGEGDKQVGDDPVIADDPYKGKTVTERDEAGHPLTQKSYGEDCKDDLCKRAEERQTSKDTNWKDDEATGKTTPR